MGMHVETSQFIQYPHNIQLKMIINQERALDDVNTSNGVLEIIVPSLFLVMIIVILIQCGWGRKNLKDPQEVLNKPVDVEEGKKDGAAGLVDQVADQVSRGIGY